MQIDDHNNSSFDCDTEQSDVTDQDGNAEVVTENPLQQQAAADRIEGGKNQNQGFGNRAKYQIQQKENREEDHRQDQLQPFFCPQLKFIFS